MSEDFDKEAERKKLREKYEQDKKKREATEQMSELLLQGATMTNAHCSACSDPIFRYDGQEFCPTCEKPVDREESQDEPDEESIEVTAPSEEARVAFGKETNGSASETAGSTDQQTEQPATPSTENQQPVQSHPQTQQPANRQSPAQDQQQPQSAPQQRSQTEHQPVQNQQADTHEIPSVEPGTTSVGDAKQSLVRTLTRLSKQAETADDPREAKDHLEAARAAAETLSALRQS